MKSSVTFMTIAFGLSTALYAQQEAPETRSLKAHPGWVQVPGALIRPDCVHEIPLGAKVEIDGDITLGGSVVAHYDACPEQSVRTRPSRGIAPKFSDAPGTGNGWVEAIQMDVSLSSGDNIDEMTGTWTVPKAPAKNGGLVYIFNGIEPTSENLIMQPVLQYGATSAGGLIGGNEWVLASWLVGSNAYHSPGIKVSPGDKILGTTFMTSDSGGKLKWEIWAQDVTTGAYSWLDAWSTGYKWNWAFSAVLEAYNITSCSELPSSDVVTFKNPAVYHGYPSFDKVSPAFYGAIYGYGGPNCGFAPVPEGSEQQLFY